MKNVLLSEIQIDFASPIPVYEQIKKSIKHAIAKRLILENEPLPSIRQLASFLKVNPNTVARSYRELSQEKIVSGRAGIGFKVEEGDDFNQEKSDLLKDEFLKFMEKAIEMGFSQDYLEDMIVGFFRGKK